MKLRTGNSAIGFNVVSVAIGSNGKLKLTDRESVPLSVAKKIVAAYNRGDNFHGPGGEHKITLV